MAKPVPTRPGTAGDLPAVFERLMSRIGYVNYTWTNTESLLIHLIAGLVPTDKDTATILFLTLNTTRARLDLVDRLTKRADCPLPKEAQVRILDLTKRFKSLSGVRNSLNHSLYAVDDQSGAMRSIQMRIADRKTSLRIGQETVLDEHSLRDLEETLQQIRDLNAAVWAIVADYRLPA